MTTIVTDLLAALDEGSRRGVGREVDSTRPQALEASGSVAPSPDGAQRKPRRYPVEVEKHRHDLGWTTKYSDGTVEVKYPPERLPLTELRRPNGRPHYRSWEEQCRYLS